MKIAAVIAGLALFATPAMAQSALHLVSVTDEAVTFTNTKTISRTAGGAMAWFNTYYRGYQRDDIYITKMLAEYKCDARRARIVMIVGYDDRGNRVSSGENAPWTHVVPDSVGEEQMIAACSGLGFSTNVIPPMSDVELLSRVQNLKLD